MAGDLLLSIAAVKVSHSCSLTNLGWGALLLLSGYFAELVAMWDRSSAMCMEVDFAPGYHLRHGPKNTGVLPFNMWTS